MPDVYYYKPIDQATEDARRTSECRRKALNRHGAGFEARPQMLDCATGDEIARDKI